MSAIPPVQSEGQAQARVVATNSRYTLFYDPSNLLVNWMIDHGAWSGTLEAAAYGVSLGAIKRKGAEGIAAAVHLSDFSGEDLMLSIAVIDKKAWSRQFIRYVFDYVFNQIGVTRVTARISEDNDVSLDLAKRLGFTREGVLRQYRHGRDYIVLGMLRHECKWIGGQT